MVIKILKHGINLIRHSLRDVGLNVKRSGKWPTIEKHFLEENGECAACGSKDRLNVHHIIPFHDDPSKELDLNNLITLCMGRKECHLELGHLGNFRSGQNPGVIADCVKIRKNPELEDKIIEEAKKRFKK